MDEAMPIILVVGLTSGLVVGLTMLSQSSHAAHVRAWVRWTWRMLAILGSTGLVLIGGLSLMGDNIRALFATSTCYAMAAIEAAPSTLGRVIDRTRALGRIIGQEVEQAVEPLLPYWQQQLEGPAPQAPTAPGQEPTQAPVAPPAGPSCRLHPRVLQKVRLSIAQDERRARDV